MVFVFKTLHLEKIRYNSLANFAHISVWRFAKWLALKIQLKFVKH